MNQDQRSDVEGEDDFSEEIFADVYNSQTLQSEERILVVTHTSLMEMDARTAQTIQVVQLKYLVKITSNSEDDKWSIELEFNPSSLLDHRHKLSVIYHLDEPSHNSLLGLLNPALKTNEKERKIQCLACSAIFGISDGEMLECRRCKSPYVISQQDNNNHKEAVSEEPPEDLENPLIIDDDKTKFMDDLNIQLTLRLNIFQGGLDEKYVGTLHSNFIQTSKNDEERPCLIVLTDVYVYILTQHKKLLGEKEKVNLQTAGLHKLQEIERIIIAMNEQAFRFELVEGDIPYVFITRDHFATLSFMDKLTKTVQNQLNSMFDTPPPIILFNQQHIQFIEQQLSLDTSPTISELDLGESFHILLYVLVSVQTQKQSSWNFVQQDFARSLIVSDDHILLCEEDYSKWPLYTSGNNFESVKLNKPIIQMWKSHRISDLVRIELFENGSVRLVFEQESHLNTGNRESTRRSKIFSVIGLNIGNNNNDSSWIIHIVGRWERNRLLQLLSHKWKELFKVDLTIKALD
eukprot:TRINITY_DN6343_c0_g1_i2.p1 TRINITY_DN6343_c0_g1~~TRINITY_DN6343_c0_g1_i2.p1  ORF type:complete len:518 (+),score=59.10 TRINITY_DN6343_c0_g1_i2:280-1833(+)